MTLKEKQTLDDILKVSEKSPNPTSESTTSSSQKSEKPKLRVQYRGKCTEDYARALHKINAPCVIVMTLRKLKTVLPSLKPSVEKMYRSGVVYQLKCPRCTACYVGETGRHMQVRFKEHIQRQGPMKKHLTNCKTTLSVEDVDILHQTARGESFRLTLEALHIRERKPTINTKDEYRTRELTIKL